VATAHDERLKEFQKLVDAATRQLKVRKSAKKALEEIQEEEPGV
jgi:hypothetical protein